MIERVDLYYLVQIKKSKITNDTFSADYLATNLPKLQANWNTAYFWKVIIHIKNKNKRLKDQQLYLKLRTRI